MSTNVVKNPLYSVDRFQVFQLRDDEGNPSSQVLCKQNNTEFIVETGSVAAIANSKENGKISDLVRKISSEIETFTDRT